MSDFDLSATYGTGSFRASSSFKMFPFGAFFNISSSLFKKELALSKTLKEEGTFPPLYEKIQALIERRCEHVLKTCLSGGEWVS